MEKGTLESYSARLISKCFRIFQRDAHTYLLELLDRGDIVEIDDSPGEYRAAHVQKPEDLTS